MVWSDALPRRLGVLRCTCPLCGIVSLSPHADQGLAATLRIGGARLRAVGSCDYFGDHHLADAGSVGAAHAQLSPDEAADRLAIRELFDAYAHCADRRDSEGQKALFSTDTRFAVFMNGEGSEPSYVLAGREALTPVFDDLNQYDVTTHFNGQSTIELDGDLATGESYTIAHHLSTTEGVKTIMIASLRYLDTFAKVDGAWFFAERNLIVDWTETRTLAS